MSLLLLLRGHRRENTLIPGSPPLVVIKATLRNYVEQPEDYAISIESNERYERIDASDRKYLIPGKKRTFYISDE